MENSRLDKVSSLIKEETSSFLQKNAKDFFGGAIISVSVVRVSADLSIAKIYVSIYGTKDNDKVFEHLKSQTKVIRGTLGKKLGKQLRKVPEFKFFLDDSNDYADNIERLLSN
jgi:ribosome-binding factor A